MGLQNAGEFIASTGSLTQGWRNWLLVRGFDGRFRSGKLAGKTVNIKWYGKNEHLLDINENAVPDYYLVMTGEHSPPGPLRSKKRPWVISLIVETINLKIYFMGRFDICDMTLILAFIWGDGVVVVGDSRASMGHLYTEEKKIYPIALDDLNLAAVAGSGHSILVHQGFELVRKTIFKFLLEIGEKRNPTEEEVERIVKRIEEELMLKYHRIRSLRIDLTAELILAIVSQEGKPLLYHFDSAGLADPIHSTSRYVILGHGKVTGAQLLLELLGYTPEMAEDYDMSVFPAFIVDMASRVDPTVSPFLFPENSGLHPV